MVEETTQKKPKVKTADRPHYLALFFSIVAILISSLGWWETHRSRLINQEVNRPILSLSPFDIESDIPSMESQDNEDRITVIFKFRIKNVGKSTAIITKAEVNPTLVGVGVGAGGKCREVKDEHSATYFQNPGAILSGSEEEHIAEIELSLSCDVSSYWVFIVHVNLDYTDGGSVQNYSQQLSQLVRTSPAEEMKKRKARLKAG